MLFLIACDKGFKREDVVGKYIRNQGKYIDTLEIKDDGTFIQVVRCDAGEEWKLTNSWKLLARGIEFEYILLSMDALNGKEIVPPQKHGSCMSSWRNGNITISEYYNYGFVKRIGVTNWR